MVVSITPVQPSARVGPGLPLSLSSNFIGPVTTASAFFVNILNPAGPVQLLQYTFHTSGNKQTTQLSLSSITQALGTFTGQFPSNDQNVTLRADFFDGNSIVDTGSLANVTWVAQEGIGVQALSLAQQAPQSGGFTDQDRQNLTATTEATALPISLDTFTTSVLPIDPLTGFGSSSLPTGIWGVIVRMTQIADAFPPRTPDDDYRSASLCIVRIFRGSDLWLRVPVHTSNRMISLWDQNIVTAVTQATSTQWLLNMSIQVQFKPGCLGDVLFMHFP